MSEINKSTKQGVMRICTKELIGLLGCHQVVYEHQ